MEIHHISSWPYLPPLGYGHDTANPFAPLLITAGAVLGDPLLDQQLTDLCPNTASMKAEGTVRRKKVPITAVDVRLVEVRDAFRLQAAEGTGPRQLVQSISYGSTASDAVTNHTRGPWTRHVSSITTYESGDKLRAGLRESFLAPSLKGLPSQVVDDEGVEAIRARRILRNVTELRPVLQSELLVHVVYP